MSNMIVDSASAPASQSLSEEAEEGQYEVESLEKVRRRKKHPNKQHAYAFELLVHWKGYDDVTWEPLENLINDVPDMIEDFMMDKWQCGTDDLTIYKVKDATYFRVPTTEQVEAKRNQITQQQQLLHQQKTASSARHRSQSRDRQKPNHVTTAPTSSSLKENNNATMRSEQPPLAKTRAKSRDPTATKTTTDLQQSTPATTVQERAQKKSNMARQNHAKKASPKPVVSTKDQYQDHRKETEEVEMQSEAASDEEEEEVEDPAEQDEKEEEEEEPEKDHHEEMETDECAVEEENKDAAAEAARNSARPEVNHAIVSPEEVTAQQAEKHKQQAGAVLANEQAELERIQKERLQGKVEYIGCIFVNIPDRIIGVCRNQLRETLYLVTYKSTEKEVYLPTWCQDWLVKQIKEDLITDFQKRVS